MSIHVWMTDWTEAITSKRALPTPLDAVNVEFQQPLIGDVPILALEINSRRSSGSRRFGTLPGWRFLVLTHDLEFVVVTYV
jgi:hypothetical protein